MLNNRIASILALSAALFGCAPPAATAAATRNNAAGQPAKATEGAPATLTR